MNQSFVSASELLGKRSLIDASDQQLRDVPYLKHAKLGRLLVFEYFFASSSWLRLRELKK